MCVDGRCKSPPKPCPSNPVEETEGRPTHGQSLPPPLHSPPPPLTPPPLDADPDVCSAEGLCVYVDRDGDDIEDQTLCTVDAEILCYPTCVCFEHDDDPDWQRYGKACHLTLVEYEITLKLRDTMAKVLALVSSGSQDVTPANINMQATSLGSLSADPDQMDDSAAMTSVGVAEGMATGSTDVGISTATSDAMAGAVSSTLETGVTGDASSMGSVSALVGDVAGSQVRFCVFRRPACPYNLRSPPPLHSSACWWPARTRRR